LTSGGDAGDGGKAYGGAIETFTAGTVTIPDELIRNNAATGGAGGSAGSGMPNGHAGLAGTGYGGGIAAHSFQIGGTDRAQSPPTRIIGNTADVSPDVDGKLLTI
jgi:hypothetical protein